MQAWNTLNVGDETRHCITRAEGLAILDGQGAVEEIINLSGIEGVTTQTHNDGRTLLTLNLPDTGDGCTDGTQILPLGLKPCLIER